MKIDPEVAALLNENKATLPDELVQRGWGRTDMEVALSLDVGTLRRPSTVHQPTYDETCGQCGRPITYGTKGWMDHAGNARCPADLVDERVSPYHKTQAEYDSLSVFLQPVVKVEEATKACMATKTHIGHHTHQCHHDHGHFGFHECVACKELWK